LYLYLKRETAGAFAMGEHSPAPQSYLLRRRTFSGWRAMVQRIHYSQRCLNSLSRFAIGRKPANGSQAVPNTARRYRSDMAVSPRIRPFQLPLAAGGHSNPMKQTLRAISIRQPWVELILTGEKAAEYRSRATKIRERVYIYASRRPADSPPAWAKVSKSPGDLPVGVVVGTVEIVACQWDEQHGCFAYTLRNPSRLSPFLHPSNQPQPVFWRPVFSARSDSE
jgi:hypothetical protein